MSEFTDNLQEVFAPFGKISVRRMFGGYDIFHQDLMFALVVDDVLYLQADSESAAGFEERGLGWFEYRRGSKAVQMSYFEAPEEIFDETEAARLWAARAFEAALRSRKKAGKART